MKIVDYFAGAGGWSTGARQVGGRVLVALNHWKVAVDTHAANHPDTRHVCQDAGLFDPRDLPAHDLFLASPACQGHSRARGKERAEQRKHFDATRATAWCVVNVAEVCRPRALAVENVPEFREWTLYRQWRESLEALGYQLVEHVFDASSFGTPQERLRLIVTGSLRRPIQLSAPNLPAAPARELIDWSAGTWGTTEGRAARTAECIADGRARFGGRFLVPYYGNTHTARSIDRPIGTITTKDRYAVVDGDRMRMCTVNEYRRGMGFPASYVLTGTTTEQKKQLGNAIPPPLAAGCVGQIQEAL